MTAIPEGNVETNHGDMPNFESLREQVLDMALTSPDYFEFLEEFDDQDALIWMISQKAIEVVGGETENQQAQVLSAWRSHLEFECKSEHKYCLEESLDEQPDCEEADCAEELWMLNALRRGVGIAMRRSYGHKPDVESLRAAN